MANRTRALMRSSIAVGFIAVGAFTCAPSPRSVACSNRGDCEKVDRAFGYCFEHRCVECIESSSCGYPNRCLDGFCERRCRDERDCRAGELCRAGKCEAR